MLKSLHADFYVTCATVIPILYLALAVQGSGYDAALRHALRVAHRQSGRTWEDAARKLRPAVAFLPLVAGLVGEALALFALFRDSDTEATRVIVMITTLILVAIAGVGPALRWWQAQAEISTRRQREVSPSDFGKGDQQTPATPPD